MFFSKWIENRKEVAKIFRNTLSGVPQDPVHHAEGDALLHTKLVRASIQPAILELQKLQKDPEIGPFISHIDFSCTPEQLQILNLAAWLHDIGKSTATTIGGQFWKTPNATGRIQAIGHENPEHYLPQLEKFKNIAPPEVINLYEKNRELIHFLIEHHMDFTSGAGFSKGFLSRHFHNGQVDNSPEMKMLLILMWADKMGRKPEDTISAAIEKNKLNLANSIQTSQKKFANMQRKTPVFGSPQDFANTLKQKNMPFSQKSKAIKGKYPHLTDEEISGLLENFKTFLEAAEPTTIPAHIPIDKNVHILSDALKQGDSNIKVYVVGGAVRDYLYHIHHGDSTSTYKPKDIDLTTNLSEPEILEKLRSRYAIEKGIKVKEKESVDTFGVVFATVNHENYEIAPFRKDIGGSDGRRPDAVERGTIHDDAMRRDLTINNLYYDFDRNIILDFNPNGQGIKDIKERNVRSVGNPSERFAEDKLRVLRIVRFFSRFNAGDIIDNLDAKHKQAIENYKSLQGITPERIEMEFLSGIKQSLYTAGFLQSLASLNLLERILPNLNIDTQDIGKIGNLKNAKVVLAWLLRNNENVDKKLNALKYPSNISEGVQLLIDSIKFNDDQAYAMLKRRDKRLIKGNEEHNISLKQSMQQDFNDFAKLFDKNIQTKILHFANYQQPSINVQGLQGEEIGKALKSGTTQHYRISLQQTMQNT